MKLRELIAETPYVLETRGDLDTDIREITSSSRDKTTCGLFFCIVGARFDAHDYAFEAVENGCVALIVEHFVELEVPQVRVSNGRAAMSRIAMAFFGYPSRKMRLVGITGTKGKTTTTYLLKSIVQLRIIGPLFRPLQVIGESAIGRAVILCQIPVDTDLDSVTCQKAEQTIFPIVSYISDVLIFHVVHRLYYI